MIALFALFAITLTVAVFATDEEHTIHIFPTNVSNDGWMKGDLALEQSLGAQALFDDFNRSNSAFVIIVPEGGSDAGVVGTPKTEAGDTQTEEGDASDGDTVTDGDIDTEVLDTPQVEDGESQTEQGDTASGENVADDDTETDVLDTPQTEEGTQNGESVDDGEESETEEERSVEPEESSAEETASDTQPTSHIQPMPDVSMTEYLLDVSRGFRGYTARAQEAEPATEPSTQSPAEEVVEEETPQEVEEETEEAEQTDSNTEQTVDGSETDAEQVEEDVSDTTDAGASDENTDTERVDSNTEQVEGGAGDTDGNTQQDTDAISENGRGSGGGGDAGVEKGEQESVVTSPDTQAGEEGEDVRVCQVLGIPCRTIQFTGFDIGSVLSDFTVKGYELRVSLAAQTLGESFTPDKLLVRYFYRGSWYVAGEIMIDKTLSNFENGGHFAFPLPNLVAWDALRDFRVELEYVRQGEARTELFLDSVWVETTFESDSNDVVFPDNVMQELAELEFSRRGDILRTPEGLITLPYQNNAGGSLTLRSSSNVLESPGTGEVYFSVTNTGDKKKDFSLSFYMPDDDIEPEVVEQWMYNIPESTEEVTYGSVARYCESGWVLSEESDSYSCVDTGEDLWCDDVNEEKTNCIQNEVEIGREPAVAYTEGWKEILFTDVPPEEKEKNILAQVKKWFSFKSSSVHEGSRMFRNKNTLTVAPDQTLYFSTRVAYPHLSEGGFAVEATSDDNPSSLNIAWKSDWRYRLPVEVGKEVSPQNTFTVELDAQNHPHIFAHVSDWSQLFVRGVDSNSAQSIPFTHSVESGERVSLSFSSNIHASQTLYLYYGEGDNKAIGATYVSSDVSTSTKAQRKSKDTYLILDSEEVVRPDEKNHRILSGLSKDGTLSDGGTVRFAYSTNRSEHKYDGFAKIPRKNSFAVTKTTLTNNAGEVLSTRAQQTLENEWELDTGMEGRSIIPGKYSLEVEVVEGNKTYTETLELYWGVLTWNSTKSVYEVGETVEMHMAALSNNGNTLCDAHLVLKVQNPQGITTEVPVTQSGVCDGNNVTDIPDYRSVFELTELGSYNVALQHLDAEGIVLHEIEDTIIVQENTPYQIERLGPTRIYPVANYPMVLRVYSAQGFRGTVREVLPKDFEVYNYGQATEYIEGENRILEWDVSLSAGEILDLSYSFDAPDISPRVYRLGPASFGDEFTELRAWQIASDATGNMVLFWDGVSIPAGWTCISCAPGDPFYQRFIMGSSTYNTTGGATTHTHTAAGTVYAIGTASTESFGSGAIEVAGHTHTYTPTISSTSNLPPYRTLQVIQFNSAGEPATIPAGAIAVFDGTVPTGWTRYAAQDGSFVYGDATSASTGGAATHQHTISGSTGASVGGSVGSRGGGTQSAAASDAHVHTVSGATALQGHEPPYVEVVLGKLDATIAPPNGMIGMWTDEIPLGWVSLSSSSEPFENKFIKPATTYGGTGGSMSHLHSDVLGLTSSYINDASSRQGSAGSGPHSHTVDVTGFSNTSHLPPYATVVFGKRFSDEPVYTQNTFRFFVNADMEPPTDPWPVGISDLAENARITTSEHTSQGDVFRIRMSVGVSNATSTTGGDKFTLQYAEGSSCSDGGLVWADVAPIGSTTAPWRGYSNGSLSDGSAVSSTTLSTANVFQTYEEENPSASTTNDIAPGNEGEWDWVVQHHEALAGTDYCFRMVKSDGTSFSTYNNYPQVITNEAPGTPTLLTLFDNEKTPTLTPTFTFYADDPEGNPINYQIQIDTDAQFGNPVVDVDSITAAGDFSNLDTPADKSPFNSGDRMSYISATDLSNNTTYWWRVRGHDDDGSHQWGPWSSAQSFTVDTSVEISTWFQTTDEQFDTDTYESTESNGSGQVVLKTGSTTGSIISTTIDFDWGTDGNAWGYLRFTDTETASDLKYQVQYYDTAETAWELIPDSDLSGNSSGFDTSPVSLLSLDTTTYNQIRLKGNFVHSGSSPLLSDWTVEWGTRVQQPTLVSLFDNEKVATTTPVYDFYTTDPQNDDLIYQVSISEDYYFLTGSTTRTSDVDSGFQNIASSTDTSPFSSGDMIRFILQPGDALTNASTYWWRVRAKDPLGGDTWSDWSERWSFTVDTAVTSSTWYQTTDEQFSKGGLFGVTSLLDAVHVATSVKDVLLAYGEGTSETPKYRMWDGTAWGNEYAALSVGAPQYWVVTRAHPSAHSYALATIGSDADVNVQIYEGGVWGNLQEMTTTISNTNARGVDMAYESISGDLMVAYCDGDADPSYRIYNETTGWGGVGAIDLSSTNNCEWIRLASNPTSDEIIVISLDSAGGQYEAQVWNGSGWGNATVFGSMRNTGNEGMAVEYEESGNQALVVTSDGNRKAFAYRAWNGTAWSAAANITIGNHLQWGNLVRDKGTDALALCYIDSDVDIGVVHWTGSAWTGQTELDVNGNASTDRPVDCEYETNGARDGYVMTAYSDTTNARYQSFNGATWSGEGTISTITDSSTVQTARSDDGLILSLFFDDVNGRYDFSYWNGSAWSVAQTLEASPSVIGSPYKEPFMMAPRNSAVAGTLYSPMIDYDEGSGPLWDYVAWNDATPGASTLLYQVQYFDTTSSTWLLVPDGVLPGNSVGTSTSPINISNLDTTTYNQIRIKAMFTCDSGNCPTLYDWTVTWSEGFTVSGIAKQFDQTTDVTSGTVAVAVNGLLQVGKTGVISGGIWTISNVTAFQDDVITVWVDGANEANKAVAVTKYDGDGSISGMTLYERHLSLGSDDNPTLSNSDLAQFDHSVSGDEDIFYDVDSQNDLYVCESTQVTCGSEKLWIRGGTVFAPATSTVEVIHTHDIEIEGTLVGSGNTFEVSGSWENTGTFTSNTSTVVFDATSTAETIQNSGSSFFAVTFGQGASTASWSFSSPFDILGTLTLNSGTLAPTAGYELSIGGNLIVGVSGLFSATNGTTTFDGTGIATWSDASSPQQNMGTVVVDGTSKTVSLGTDVTATDIVVGADDILALGGNTLEVSGDFDNNGSLVPQLGEVLFTSTSVGNTIDVGASSFYDMRFNGAGGNWSFPAGYVRATNDLTISDGTLTLPTGTTTVGGSFAVTGGTFVHNNGLVYFTSNLPETITTNSAPFYNTRFHGNGSWTFADTNATSSGTVTFSSGSVTFPSGVFAIGGSFITTAGSFDHGNGTVRFYNTGSKTLSTNNSDLYDVIVDGAGLDLVSTGTTLRILGDTTLASGNFTLPSGVLTLGGSLLSSGGTFAHNSGTVLFAASSTGHTVSVTSPFSSVEFNSTSGGWTVSSNASSTDSWVIGNVNSFVGPSGGTIDVGGVFLNTADDTATTWDNTTLFLRSGSAFSVNDKTSTGDTYNILRIHEDTDVSMWNSSAVTYDVDGTSSLYSQDHNGVDGGLYIWGAYTRTSGTEHWSWATDFDGADISGGSERLVNVRFANGASAEISSSTLEIVGTGTASTSINTQSSGTYGVRVDNGTVNAQRYSFNNLNGDGFTIEGTSTVSALGHGSYTLAVDGGTLLRISSSTLEYNPAKQISGLHFATTSAITGYNVGVIGTPLSSYWTFKNHTGGLDGELYDDDPGGNPGFLRWDDSAFSIDILGNVYTDEGYGVPGYCDGTTPVVHLVVNGTGSYSSSCAPLTGAYSIPSVTFSGDVVITTYLKTAGTRGVVITKTPNATIDNLDLYEHRVIVRHEDTAPLTIEDMAYFDSTDDVDIPFSTIIGAPNSLTLLPETKLYVWPEKEFAPGGDITLLSGGSGVSYDGSLYIGSTSTLTAVPGEVYSVGGSWESDELGTFTGDATVIFTATTSGKSIAPASNFSDVVFTGTGGVWSIASSTTVRGGVTISAGTLTGNNHLTVFSGPFVGNGTVSMSGGTVTMLSGGDFGGNSDWTFNNLLFSTTTSTTTSKVGSGRVVILGKLSLDTLHTLEAGGGEWVLSGSGTVFESEGTFLPQSGTVIYNGVNDLTVASTDYNVLSLTPSSGNPIYTIDAGNFEVASDLLVGGGTTLTVTANTNDPLIRLDGDMIIAANATYEGASANDLFVGGSYENSGVYNANGGGIIFDSTNTGETVNAGGSSFHHVYFKSDTGGWTITENLTSTGNFSLSSSSDWTLASGKVLEVQGAFSNAVGGVSTNWDGTLYLNSGTSFSINTKNQPGDIYSTISVGASTHPRMWYSTSTQYSLNASGSLYSQDHNNVDGDLYIFGTYTRATGADYWSYATDFDGISLAGGTERVVDVYISNGGSVTLSGGVLNIVGTTSATTTVDVQHESGTYGISVTGGTLNASYFALRHMNGSGLSMSGSPTISALSDGDFELSVNGGNLMTVAASTITANPIKIMYRNRFSTSTGATTGNNVSVTGSTGSSWRFTEHYGGFDGEGYDVDPGGDPGYVIWDDSAAQITISGSVRGTDESSVSAVCDGSTPVVRFMINGANPRTTSCNPATGYYEFSNITYVVGDVFTVYLNTGGAAQAVNVTVDPMTNIGDMDLYEERVIVRHEGSEPITIADLSVYDADNDADIPFNANLGPNTLTLTPGTKLVVWSGKSFAPGGAVTLASQGTGTAHDGTLELKDNAQFIASGSETHTVGGSLVSGAGASVTPGNSTFVFSATTTGKTVDTNTSPLANVTFSGVGGSWTFLETSATTTGDLTITNGTVTLPTDHITIGGSFINSSVFVGDSTDFTFTGGGAESITFGGYDVGSIHFERTGSVTITDTNATSTGSVTVESGSVAMPSGYFAVQDDFINEGGVVTHNNGTLEMYGTNLAQVLRFGSSTMGNLLISGLGSWAFADTEATTTGSVHVANGVLTAPPGSLAVGGSLTASSTFNPNASILHFFATSQGHTVDVGNAVFASVIFDGVGGGWTVNSSATSTSDWIMENGASFTMATSTVLEVGGIFKNHIGGTATDWTDSLLYLNASGTTYTVNDKSDAGDTYANLAIGNNTYVSMWNSSGVTTTVDDTGYLYSMDHAGNDGSLNIYGAYERTSGGEYWSYAKDFDGTAVSRAVDVRIASSSSVTLRNVPLEIVGIAGATSTVDVLSTGAYALAVYGGALNAQYYSIAGTDMRGFDLQGSPTITTLNYGAFELSTEGGTMVTVSSSTINQNPSRTFSDIVFSRAVGVSTGYNVTLDGETNSIWQFINHSGNYDGEDYDNDGGDACGQLRWADSSCLEVAQTHYSFRNDNGGEGAPDAEWYDVSWEKRRPIKINNSGNSAVNNLALKVEVPYDSDMQADFDDLRFTDSSGTTSLPYWFEDVVLSATATVWVKVPSVPADGVTRVYMYYDNALATSSENGVDTFTFFEDFEDNSLSAYSGSATDLSYFATNPSFNYEGSYGLSASGGNTDKQTSGGIYRTSPAFSQGSSIRFFQKITAGTDDEPCTLFGVQGSGSNYAVCLDQYPADKVEISKNVTSNSDYGTASELNSTSVTWQAGWYEVVIDWLTDNSINVTVYDSAGSVFATVSATDSSYTSGGMGFSFWYQSQGWDFYSVRPYVSSDPAYSIGVEQMRGGATFKGPQDTVLVGQPPNENFRLRLTVENTGMQITNQAWRLQYAPKSGYGACEGVPAVAYDDVPSQASCGTSPICMNTSSYITDQEATTEHLVSDLDGSFVNGHMVESPSNQTSAMTIEQDEYTELEYVLEFTDFATDSNYCLRTTNGGVELDTYLRVAEATVRFAPVITDWKLNGDQPISLTEGSTHTIHATGTVSDLNGFEDLMYATTSIYRSGVSESCLPDDNNCYQLNSLQCPLINCSGNSCEVNCSVDIAFFAEPTDFGTYADEHWEAYLYVVDLTNNIATSTSVPVDLRTLWAIAATTGTIEYGTLGVGEDTGSANATTSLQNTGNDAIDVQLIGTDLQAPGSSIPVSNQKVATSSFTYSSCVICSALSGVATTFEVDLVKPTSTEPVTDTLYWGIYVPVGTGGVTHYGENTFYATGD